MLVAETAELTSLVDLLTSCAHWELAVGEWNLNRARQSRDRTFNGVSSCYCSAVSGMGSA